jgi:hypothetical protein
MTFFSLANCEAGISGFLASKMLKNSFLFSASIASRMLSACMGTSRGIHFLVVRSGLERFLLVAFFSGGNFGESFGAPHDGDKAALFEDCGYVVEISVDFAGFVSATVARAMIATQIIRLFLLFSNDRKVRCITYNKIGF